MDGDKVVSVKPYLEDVGFWQIMRVVGIDSAPPSFTTERSSGMEGEQAVSVEP